MVCLSDPDLYRLLTCHVPNLMSLFHCLALAKRPVQARGACIRFVTRPVFKVRSCQHLAQPLNCRTTPCRLFIQYIRSYPPSGGRSSIRNLRMRQAVVTGTNSSWDLIKHKYVYIYIIHNEGCVTWVFNAII